MANYEELIENIKENLARQKKAVKEIINLSNTLENESDSEEKKMISSQIESLKNFIKIKNSESLKSLNGIYLTKPLQKTIEKKPESLVKTAPIQKKEVEHGKLKKMSLGKIEEEFELEGIEKTTLKRLKKKEKVEIKKIERKPLYYAKLANEFFSKYSNKLLKKKFFSSIERELIKANLPFTANTYTSMILFTTFLSIVFAVFAIFFFMFFNIGVNLPIITRTTEAIPLRLAKTLWMIIVLPFGTFFMMYVYPSLEKKSTETKIDYELPFATINMSAISGSLIDPSKIFQIIITTKEYPFLSKEFARIINEINIQGYNFVSALRNAAFNTPSKKLSELFSGLATTINSGGDLPNFFDERSKSLLFEHRIEKEKQSKAAETFMDIYISVVIAAPMILMLLLMMMRISGLGISLSTGTITLIMVLGVTIINVVFLSFLHLKKG